MTRFLFSVISIINEYVDGAVERLLKILLEKGIASQFKIKNIFEYLG